MSYTKSFLLALVLLFSGLLSAQNVTDALRFSNIDPSGTARYLGAGSAMGPLGADMSVVGTNPAGLALFRKSEFTVTPGLFLNNTNATVSATGEAFDESRAAFNFHNIGVVMASRPITRKWRTSNFAITLNNIGNFNRQFSYQGNTTGSIAQRWQELANDPAIGLNSFEAGLAFDAGVIYDIDANPDDYEIDYEGFEDQPLEKGQTVTTRGSASELSFSYAANYDERLMIGISIGLPLINFEYESIYTEADEKSPSGGRVPYFEGLEYEDQFTTNGGGINAKLGLIYRVNQTLRFSGAVHTPTRISLEDEYETVLINNYFADPDESGEFVGGDATSTGLFEYRLVTPWRFFGGVGLLLGKNGFISGEVELVDYNNNRFRYDGFDADEDFVNGEIQNRLTDVLNIRLGGELVADIFRFRAGAGIFPSAYVADDTRTYSFSAGVGVRQESFFVDLGYRYTSYEELFFPYDTQSAELQEIVTDFGLHRLLFTFGLKF